LEKLMDERKQTRATERTKPDTHTDEDSAEHVAASEVDPVHHLLEDQIREFREEARAVEQAERSKSPAPYLHVR
jgi:hypothetical protein